MIYSILRFVFLLLACVLLLLALLAHQQAPGGPVGAALLLLGL